MKRSVNLLFLMTIFLFVGCEDEKADNDNMSVNEVTTDNVNDGPYYFNFVTCRTVRIPDVFRVLKHLAML